MATAFCGLCTGCATDIENGKAQGDTPTAAVSAVGTEPKVILNPGWASGRGSTANTIATGATKLDSAAEGQYFVENAYFATVAAGETLPEATRAGYTFDGWVYAVDGEIVKVTTMPTELADDLYLYAQWTTTGGVNPNPNPNPGPTPGPVTSGAAVNGQAMLPNSTTEAGVEAEYMLTGVQFAKNTALSFTFDGSPVTLAKVEGSSSGITKTTSPSTTKAGTFQLYLKHKTDGTWTLYAACDSQPISATDAVAGGVYLAGVIDSDNLTWNHWNDDLNTHKGIRAESNGASYTLTVELTEDDDCKFVQYAENKTDRKWQSDLSGGGSNITLPSGGNMSVKTSGTYTFTITVSGNALSVSVTKDA